MKRGFVAQRLIFADPKYAPEALKGLQGGNAMIAALGDIGFLEGDLDKDTIRAMIAMSNKGDKTSALLARGHAELEAHQLATLKANDVEYLQKMKGKLRESTQMMEQYISAVNNDVLTDKQRAELAEGFIKVAGKDPLDRMGVRVASEQAALSAKMLTGLVDSDIKLRQIAAGSWDNLGKHHGSYIDFTSALEEMVISKHKVADKESLQIIASLNDATHAAAQARQRFGASSVEFQKARGEARSAMQATVDAAHAAYSSEKIGFQKPSAAAVTAFTNAEIDYAPTLHDFRKNWKSTMASQDKYSPHTVLRQLEGLLFDLSPNASAQERQFYKDLGLQARDSVSVVERASAKAATLAANAAEAEVKHHAPGTVARKVSNEILGTIMEHPRTAGLIGLTATALLAMGVYKLAKDNSDKAWGHVAGQQDPGPVTPRSEFYVQENEVPGQLTGRANVPPNAIMGMAGFAQRLGLGSDIRVLDSRLPISSRLLGYDAANRMNSIYARSDLQ